MRTVGFGSLFMLGVFVVGCVSDFGSIAVSWRVGLSDDCAGSGIMTVRVILIEEGGRMRGPFDANCTAGENGATFEIADVVEGSFAIQVEGLDGDWNVIYAGHSTGRTRVTGGKTATPAEIILSSFKAELTIQWHFQDLLGCPAEEGAPDEVEIVLFKSNSLERTETEDCTLTQHIIDDLDADPDYGVQVTAKNGNTNTELFRFGQEDICLAAGERFTVTGTFVPCAAAGCD